MRTIEVDMRKMEMLDDENASRLYYGGIVVVTEGEVKHSFYPSGTDLDDGPWTDLRNFLTEKFSLDFSKIESELNKICDSNEGAEAEEKALFKVQDYWYLHNIGEVVELTAEPSGLVVGLCESESHSTGKRLRTMVENELIKVLNGPGVWFAYDHDTDTEFSFRWNEGKAVVHYNERDYTFAASAIELS